jgi:hypothetical protein
MGKQQHGGIRPKGRFDQDGGLMRHPIRGVCGLGHHENIARLGKRGDHLRGRASYNPEARVDRNILHGPGKPVLQPLACESDFVAQLLDVERVPAASQRPEFAHERQAGETDQHWISANLALVSSNNWPTANRAVSRLSARISSRRCFSHCGSW